MFAFNNGQSGISSMPIQDPVGVFHEEALQFYDYVVAVAGAVGIRLILPLGNHWYHNMRLPIQYSAGTVSSRTSLLQVTEH